MEEEVVPGGSGVGRGRHENHGGLQHATSLASATREQQQQNKLTRLATRLRTLVKAKIQELVNIYERKVLHKHVYTRCKRNPV